MANSTGKNLPDQRRKGQAFLDELRQFHQSRGSPFKKIPIVGGKELDLSALYIRVVSLGGFAKVSDKNQWSELGDEFHFPRSCSNAAFALKQYYLRYLEKYEKVHHFGEDDDEAPPGNPKASLPIGAIPCSYNYQQHTVSDYLRQSYGLSTDFVPPCDYNKLVLSLLSGLPNEVDFAVNVCTLLSNESKHVMQLDKDPKLVTLLLAHAGVFDDSLGTFSTVFGMDWKEKTSRDFVKFWKDVVEDAEVRELIWDKSSPAHDGTSLTCGGGSGGGSGADPSPWQTLFHPPRDSGIKDMEAQRVLQVAVILRNLSFEEANVKLLAASRTCLRFLLLCAHCSLVSLRQLGLDALGNVAAELQLDPVDFRTTHLMFHTITKCLMARDRFLKMRAMEILGNLSKAEDNGVLICEYVDQESYREVVALLTLPDLMLLMASLEVLYLLAQLGESPCSRIAAVDHSIDLLVRLVSVDLHTFGPDALTAVKLIEHQASASQVAEVRPQLIEQVPPPVPGATVPGATVPPPPAVPGAPVPGAPVPGVTRAPGQPTPPPPGIAEVDGDKFTMQWLHAHFEAIPEGTVSRSEVYSEYLATCSKMGRSNILNSTGFLKCLRTIFPNHTMRRQEEAKANGQVQILLVGLRRRAIPLPVPLYYQQQNPVSPSTAKPEGPGDPPAPPPPPGLPPGLPGSLPVRAPAPSLTPPVAFAAQEPPPPPAATNHNNNNTTVPRLPTPQQAASPNPNPSSAQPAAAAAQQVRPAPAVQIPAGAAHVNHSPQQIGTPPPPPPPPPPAAPTQQHSPSLLPAGTPVTLFQQVVPQGHILTARVQGVCPPIVAQRPPLAQTPPTPAVGSGAPPLPPPQQQQQQQEAHFMASVSAAAVSSIQNFQVAASSGQVFTIAGAVQQPNNGQGSPRVGFQNIAPKPAGGCGPAAVAMAPGVPNQQQQQQQQSVVIVSPNPQQSPAGAAAAAYSPAIHQIVLANPAIQIAGQPAAPSSPCPAAAVSQSNVQIQQQPPQTISHMLSIQRHQQQPQQLQIISQQPPPLSSSSSQPAPTSSATESSLIKQLLLPKRGPATPGGKLILPAPQVPQQQQQQQGLPSSGVRLGAPPGPQLIYHHQQQQQQASPQPGQQQQQQQHLNVQLVQAGGPLQAAGTTTVQIVPGQLISTAGGPVVAGGQQVTWAVVPNTGFPTASPPPFLQQQQQQQQAPAPLRGDKIICQKEEEAKDATGLHIHERKIEVMENSSVAPDGGSSAPNGKTSNGNVSPVGVGVVGAKLLNGRKCMETSLPPYHSGNNSLNGPASAEGQQQQHPPSANGKQALSPGPGEDHLHQKTLVNGVCDFGESPGGNPATNFSKNIPNHVASKQQQQQQYLGNGEVGARGSEPPQQAVERLANGPQGGGARGPPPPPSGSSELSNGPVGLGHTAAAAPSLRQQLVPSNATASSSAITSSQVPPPPANGLALEATPRGLKRPAEEAGLDATPAAPATASSSSGIPPNKVGVRIITISDPNNAGSSSTMVAVPAGTDPSTVAKVAIENAAAATQQQRHGTTTTPAAQQPQAHAGWTQPTTSSSPAPPMPPAQAGSPSPVVSTQHASTVPRAPEHSRKAGQNFKCLWQSCKRWFETPSQVFYHAATQHGSKETYGGMCQWEGCEPFPRQRLSFITHLQDKHCSRDALIAGLKLEEQAQQSPNQNASQTPPVPVASSSPAPRPQKAIVNHPSAALMALRRGSRNLVFRDFTDEKEGPMTKHIRLTAALTLKNIAKYSDCGRKLVKRHETHLSVLALSNMEVSTTLAKCLYELTRSLQA